jgi:hypothetical protein
MSIHRRRGPWGRRRFSLGGQCARTVAGGAFSCPTAARSWGDTARCAARTDSGFGPLRSPAHGPSGEGVRRGDERRVMRWGGKAYVGDRRGYQRGSQMQNPTPAGSWGDAARCAARTTFRLRSASLPCARPLGGGGEERRRATSDERRDEVGRPSAGTAGLPVTPWDNAGEGSRTPNLLIRSQMLYPIELRPQRRAAERGVEGSLGAWRGGGKFVRTSVWGQKGVLGLPWGRVVC